MMGPPSAQPPSRSRSGSKLEPRTKHRLSGSVSDVPYSPQELSTGDASGNGNPTSGGSSSGSLKDKRNRRRTRSSLGGTEDLVKELDTLNVGSNKSGSRELTATPPTISQAGGGPDNSAATHYPALKAQPSDPVEDSGGALPVILSGSESVTGDSSSDKESVTSGQKVISSDGSKESVHQGPVAKVDSSFRPVVTHPDVVELETQGGSAVQLKAGAYSTDEDKDLWICRQCGWTYPNAHPSAKHRKNHKKVCEKLYTGVEVPPGSSDDASSDDELHNKDPVASVDSSTTLPQTPVKADANDEAIKKHGAVPRTFIKPTISTGSESSKNSPVTSPGKRDSPFSSPAKRDSHLTSPAKKETPWGSPIKRNTPVSSPSTSKKVSSPITSPVKRIMSTPVKRNSPPRPEKQEGVARTMSVRQQQEEEERKISVKKRIEELERIAGSKPHTWKDYVGDGKKSGELSSSGSPLRHGDDDRRRSGEMSPSGKTLKHVEVGGRRSADSSPGKPLRHVQSSKKNSELPSISLTVSPVTHNADRKSGEVSQFPPASPENQSSTIKDATIIPPDSSTADSGRVVAPATGGSDSKESLEPKAEMPESPGQPGRTSVGSEDTTAGKDTVTEVLVEDVPHEDAVVTLLVERVQAADAVILPPPSAEHTVVANQKVDEERKVVLLEPDGLVQDKSAKGETDASSRSRGPSLVLDKGVVPLVTGAQVQQDSGAVIPYLEMGKSLGQIVDADNAHKVVQAPEISTGTESSKKTTDTPLDTENVIVKKEAPESKEEEASTGKQQSVPLVSVNTMPVKEQSSSAVAAPVAVEEHVVDETSSLTAEDSSEALRAQAEISVPPHKVPSRSDGVTAEPDAEKIPSSEVSSESRTVKSPDSDDTDGNVSPSSRPVDHDDDTSILLTKQPAVDPLFVDSQQDRLWEMHSQELTRRDGETSGTDVRESSAQDDDPNQYANGSPLTPEASASGTSNGNGVNEKGGKVDRPRTPLRSLMAEDDAADKGGDEGAPTGKETPIVSPRGNLFKRIVSGGRASPTKPSTPSMYEKKSHSKPFLSSCICCSPVK